MALFSNIGGSYKKIISSAVNINGTWRNVTEVYVNINGTWRRVYFDVLERLSVTPLSVGRYHLAAASVGDYALFGGGYAADVYRNEVDAYFYK